MCDFSSIRKTTKFVHLGMCLLIIAIGVLRFVFKSLLTTPVYFILNTYIILLGLVCFLAELEIEFILKHFNLLRYYFGKAFFLAL